LLLVVLAWAQGNRLSADTLTLTSHARLNGNVQYDGSFFCLDAHFPKAGHETYTIPSTAVDEVEINNIGINPGPPPSGITSFAYNGGEAQPCSPAKARPMPLLPVKSTAVSIVLVNGDTLAGNLVSISRTAVVVLANSKNRRSLSRDKIKVIRVH
jgi:hypothetical protein